MIAANQSTTATVVLPLSSHRAYTDDVRLDGIARPEDAGVLHAGKVLLQAYGSTPTEFELEPGALYVLLHASYNTQKNSGKLKGYPGLELLGTSGGSFRWAVLLKVIEETWQLDFDLPGSHNHTVGKFRLWGTGTLFERRDYERRFEEAPVAWPEEDSLADDQYRVTFEAAPWDVTRTIARVRGKTAFAARSGVQPQIRETWIVEIEGESATGKSYFLRLVRRIVEPQAGTATVLVANAPSTTNVTLGDKSITEPGVYQGTALAIDVPSKAGMRMAASCMYRLAKGQTYLLLNVSGNGYAHQITGVERIFDYSDEHGGRWTGLFLITEATWEIQVTIFGYKLKPNRLVTLRGDRSSGVMIGAD